MRVKTFRQRNAISVLLFVIQGVVLLSFLANSLSLDGGMFARNEQPLIFGMELGDGGISQGNESMTWNKTWNSGTGTDAAFGVWSDGNVVYTSGYAGLQMVLTKWYSGNGSIAWSQTWGGGGTDHGMDVWCDGSYVYVIGYTNSIGAGGYDVAIVKWDVNGIYQDENTWGYSGSWERGCGIWGNASGIFTTGCSNRTSTEDIIIIMWDANLNQVWNNTWGGPGVDQGYDISGDSTGIYTCGYTNSYKNNHCYVSLIKWSLSGSLLWNETFGKTGNIDHWGFSVWCDGSNVYTFGTVLDLFSGSNRDNLLVRWDQTGKSVSNGSFGGTADDVGQGVWGDGTYLYTNGFSSSFSAGIDKFLLVKWNSSCDPLWYRTWGGSNYDQGYNVWANASAVFTCGRTNSPPADPTGDIALVKWDAHGERPAADFNQNTTTVIVGRWVGFNYTGTKGDGPTSYEWDFGTGMSATGENVTFQFGTVGTFSVNLSVRDVDGDEDFEYKNILITVYNPVPVLTQPTNITYTHDVPGNNITWVITDEGGTGTTGYTVTHDGDWVDDDPWANGSTVVIPVDGLPVGIHNYTIIANDGIGGISQDTVSVTVLNALPNISQPANIAYTFGAAGNSITWIIIDESNGTTEYEIFCNGLSRGGNTWINGTPVVINVDGLAAGTYNYTIIADDGIGGISQDTVIVAVNPQSPATPGYPMALTTGFLLLGIVLVSMRMTRTKSKTRNE